MELPATSVLQAITVQVQPASRIQSPAQSGLTEAQQVAQLFLTAQNACQTSCAMNERSKLSKPLP
jgi:hypothetical protein